METRGLNQSRSARSHVKIAPNPLGTARPKMGALGNFSTNVGTLLTFTATATTYDGNPPNFFLDGAPEGASIDPDSGVFTWTPSSAQLGNWTFLVQAADAEGRFDEQAITVTVSLLPTSTSVSSDTNPSSPGQSVTFTATVSTSGGGTPTGTVSFQDGTTVLGTGTLAMVGGSDQASFTTSALALGSHTITAVYGGDGTFSGSTDSLTQTVSQFGDVMSLSSSANPSSPGDAVTFTATVFSDEPGSPTGTATFQDGTTVLGTGTLALVNGNDQATFITSALAAGSHDIIAIYGGDNAFAPNSSSLTQTVGQATQSGSSTSVTSSSSSSLSGQSVTFTATVSGTGGTPTGMVTFQDGTTVLGTGTLAVVNGSDQATFTTSALAVGSHTIIAIYGGDGTFSGSSGSLTQTVNPGANSTSTLLSSSANPSGYGQSVTFTATVSGSGGTPTGTITFEDGTTVLGTANLAVVNGSDQATLTTSALALGSHTITAVYTGDSTFAGSSSFLNQTVNQAATSIALSSAANPASAGQDVTLTTTVMAPLGGTPTGTVTIYDDGGDVVGTGTLAQVNGSDQFTVTTSTLAVGDHLLWAVYSGDGNFLGSTSDILDQFIDD